MSGHDTYCMSINCECGTTGSRDRSADTTAPQRAIKPSIDPLDRIAAIYCALMPGAVRVDIYINAHRDCYASVGGSDADSNECGDLIDTVAGGSVARPSEAIAALLADLESRLDAQTERLNALKGTR